ncbi:MAG TPA: hypothetical protein VI197_17650 [Polyangiaceae bacterium]
MIDQGTGVRGLAGALIACLACFIGCSGDDGGTAGGDPAATALARHDCYVGLQLPGVTHTGFACSGTGTSSSVSAFHPNTLEVAIRVSMDLAEEPALGELTLTSLVVEVPDGDVPQRWDAPVQACTAVASDTAVDEQFGWTYFSIEFSCSEPALPQDGNPGDPLDLGAFSIVTFFG